MKQLTFKAMCLFALLINLNVAAQYTVTPISPPPNFTFNDLWHFTLVRSNGDGYTQFYVSLRIFDGSNTLKVKSNTINIALPVGSHYYNTSNITSLQPFTTSYYSAPFLQDAISTGGQFPPGTYNITYTLHGKTPDGEFVPLAEESIQAIIDIMWPPILLWPDDKDTLEDPYPPLSWTPAFSSSYNGPITYNLKIVEMLPGQKPDQAILSNPNFFALNGINNTFYPYSASAPPLQLGNTYAWQVHAVIGSTTAQSQIWQFTYATQQAVFTLDPGFFTPLTKTLDGSYYLAKERILKIKYTEEYEVPTDAYLLYNIYDKNGVKVRSSLPPMLSSSQGIKKGDNYITLSLSSAGLNLTSLSDFYILEVMNRKNEKWYLRFISIVGALTPENPNPSNDF